MLQVERDENGWNLARLVKRQQQEADRQGPMRPVSLPSIEISDASVAIKDGNPSGVSLPRRIDDVDVSAQFEYAPVHYSLTLDHMSFRGTSPNVALKRLKVERRSQTALRVRRVQLQPALTQPLPTGAANGPSSPRDA